MTYPPIRIARACRDGYNWRKYGQKKVKTSQYPRSYYKCTHPNCKVKKKLQCTPEGQITEIIYNGVHGHPRPQCDRQEILRTSFLHNQASEASNGSGEEGEAGSNWEAGGLETSTSVLTANSEPWSNSEAKLSCAIFESDATPELSLGDDTDDESASKRRKIEICAHKQRVVVLIDSGVDVLDDGFCWRKYGKRFVKGNVNPRSYYKCTSTGCSVRKQVERASHNWRSISIMYAGKHNHEVPGAENLSLGGDGVGAISPTASSSTQPTHAFFSNANSPKAEAQFQYHTPCLQRTHDLDNAMVRSALLEDFQSGKKFESPPSVYQLKLTNSIMSGSFVPNFPMPSSPLSISISESMEPSCSNVNNRGRENSFAAYCFGWRERLWENDTRLIEPYNQEQRDGNLRSIPLPLIVNHKNASQTSSSSSLSSSWSAWSV